VAPAKEMPIVPFASASLWEQWLAENHAQPDGIWLKIAKKASGIESVTYDQALDVALCHGWIDGQRRAYDNEHFIQRLTPRRPRSQWSQRNIQKVAALTAAGRMQPAGLAQVEAAKRDGRWDAAREQAESVELPA
jgi:uncharacterized protein YdeI (YjbR/CyaY-like superfamily)